MFLKCHIEVDLLQFSYLKVHKVVLKSTIIHHEQKQDKLLILHVMAAKGLNEYVCMYVFCAGVIDYFVCL